MKEQQQELDLVKAAAARAELGKWKITTTTTTALGAPLALRNAYAKIGYGGTTTTALHDAPADVW